MDKIKERWPLYMSSDINLQQIAESVTRSVLNASDKDLEGFQRIIEESIKVREGHRNLQKLVKNYANSIIQR
jgi:hypothetical protein